MLLDLIKGFELVLHQKLIDAARGRGYPLSLLRMSPDVDRLDRSVSAAGVYSRTIRASRGITAGIGFARRRSYTREMAETITNAHSHT